MSSFHTEHRFSPCTTCGASLEQTRKHLHVCDPDRRASHQLNRLRGEISAFEERLAAFLESPKGRFETWLAERDRTRPA